MSRSLKSLIVNEWDDDPSDTEKPDMGRNVSDLALRRGDFLYPESMQEGEWMGGKGFCYFDWEEHPPIP